MPNIEKTTEAVGTADDVDTSKEDEFEDSDGDLEDSDINWDDGDEVEDESDSDDDDSEATDDDSDDDEDSDDDAESKDSKKKDPEAEEDSTESSDEKKPTEQELADRKRQNQESAARRVAAKQQREQAKSDAQSKYIAEGVDETQRALRRLEVDGYNNRIMTVTNQLHDGVIRARENIDLFASKEPAIQEAMFQAVDDFEARFVEKDDNGDFVDIRIDPETGEKANVQTYLANRAEAIRKLTGLGAKQQEQAKKSQKKRTTTMPTRKPVKKSDPMMDAFDEEADR